MPATLTLNNKILTLTDEGATSSVDLSAVKGDRGMRGAQGKAGVILNADGSINMEGYATEEYVNDVALNGIDLSDYATTEYVDNAVDNVSVDLSGYVTEIELDTKGYQTEAQVLALIQANIPDDGDEVSY